MVTFPWSMSSKTVQCLKIIRRHFRIPYTRKTRENVFMSYHRSSVSVVLEVTLLRCSAYFYIVGRYTGLPISWTQSKELGRNKVTGYAMEDRGSFPDDRRLFFWHHVKTGSEAHWDIRSLDTGVYFFGSKAAGTWPLISVLWKRYS
jgi:hypothetical protein